MIYQAHESAGPRMLFKSYNREKLINAIIYFASNTKHCHTLKLFKLLHFLDFEHFRQTGHSVTGLSYKAWQQGPAPNELWHELANPRPDLSKAVAVWTIKDDLTNETLRRDIKPRRRFDSRYFTRRELRIMERLALFFNEMKANDMSGFSHMRGMPWFKVYNGGKGNGRVIPYEIALTSQPIIEDMPSLDQDELAYRMEALKEVMANTE